MHDAERVRGPQCRRNSFDDANHSWQRQRAGVGQSRLQIDAFEVLHDEIRQTVERGVEVEDLDDVGVAQRGHDLRLATKPPERILVGQQMRPQDLHGEAPGQSRVRRLVDLAHPSLPDDAHRACRCLAGRGLSIPRPPRAACRWSRSPPGVVPHWPHARATAGGSAGCEASDLAARCRARSTRLLSVRRSMSVTTDLAISPTLAGVNPSV